MDYDFDLKPSEGFEFNIVNDNKVEISYKQHLYVCRLYIDELRDTVANDNSISPVVKELIKSFLESVYIYRKTNKELYLKDIEDKYQILFGLKRVIPIFRNGRRNKDFDIINHILHF